MALLEVLPLVEFLPDDVRSPCLDFFAVFIFCFVFYLFFFVLFFIFSSSSSFFFC